MAIQCVAAVCCSILAAATVAADGEQRVPDPAPTPETYTINVAVVIYPGVELLDFAGPGEVFAVAGNYGRWQGQRAFNVYTVAADADPIESQGFVTVTPEYTIANAPKPDVLVLPGGPARQLTNHQGFMD